MGILLARDAQAKLALIIAQMYLNGQRMDSVHVSVCPRQLESMELSMAANFAARGLSVFPKVHVVQGTHVWHIFGLFRLFLIN